MCKRCVNLSTGTDCTINFLTGVGICPAIHVATSGGFNYLGILWGPIYYKSLSHFGDRIPLLFTTFWGDRSRRERSLYFAQHYLRILKITYNLQLLQLEDFSTKNPTPKDPKFPTEKRFTSHRECFSIWFHGQGCRVLLGMVIPPLIGILIIVIMGI